MLLKTRRWPIIMPIIVISDKKSIVITHSHNEVFFFKMHARNQDNQNDI